MRIVLASASPSRRFILESAGVDPIIHPANIDEDALIASLNDAPPREVILALCAAKAEAVAAQYPDDIVIGCDSMLLLNGTLQGKPHTIDATINRWKAQRGKPADLITGHCIVAASTSVTFGDVSDADIDAYARSGEPLKCAGAFTLEALGGWFIDRINGDPSNVIGLSLPLVRRALYSFGIDVADVWR